MTIVEARFRNDVAFIISMWLSSQNISKLKLKAPWNLQLRQLAAVNDPSRCPGRSPQWSGATSHHRRRCGRIRDLQRFVAYQTFSFPLMPLDAFSNHPSLMGVYSYWGPWWILMESYGYDAYPWCFMALADLLCGFWWIFMDIWWYLYVSFLWPKPLVL